MLKLKNYKYILLACLFFQKFYIWYKRTLHPSDTLREELHSIKYSFLCIDENIDIILYLRILKYKAKTLAFFATF